MRPENGAFGQLFDMFIGNRGQEEDNQEVIDETSPSSYDWWIKEEITAGLWNACENRMDWLGLCEWEKRWHCMNKHWRSKWVINEHFGLRSFPLHLFPLTLPATRSFDLIPPPPPCQLTKHSAAFFGSVHNFLLELVVRKVSSNSWKPKCLFHCGSYNYVIVDSTG